jgi:hypothetical protein
MQCSLDHIFLPLRHGGLSIWNSQCEADGAPQFPWASYRTPAGLGSRRNLAASPALSAPAYYTHTRPITTARVGVRGGRAFQHVPEASAPGPRGAKGSQIDD